MQGKLQQVYRVSKELGQNSLLSGSFRLSKLPRLGSLVMATEAELAEMQTMELSYIETIFE